MCRDGSLNRRDKVKRRLSRSNGERFSLVSDGDGAVVRALRTEHCFVTCDAVLMFFAVPKTTVNYFLRNWNTKLAKFFTSFVCLV